jgi:RHS repeat-associated protein
VLGCETCTSVTFTAPAAQRWNVIAGGDNEIGAGATIAGASPNTTIAATLGSSDHWAMVGVAVKPVGGSGKAAAWEFASFQSPGEADPGSRMEANPASPVKSRPRQVKGLRMQLSLVRETGVVWRSYYLAGAARIAMRQDNDAGSEVIYLFADHLGSTSATYRVGDGQVERQWYKPWGEVRQSVGQLPTDHTFQGQRDAGWGLYYFKARWYDSNLGRFAQADTIIPGAGFSIAWDRYAGMLNNPVKYADPSGHRPACAYGEDCEIIQSDFRYFGFTQNRKLAALGITFTGTWTDEMKASVLAGAEAVGFALARNKGLAEAFRKAYAIDYSSHLVFQWGDCTGCNGSGGYTANSHLIQFASWAPDWRTDKELRRRNVVVHELGHALNQGLDSQPAEGLGRKQNRDPRFPNRPDFPEDRANGWTGDRYGFTSEQNVLTWQMSTNLAGSLSEEWADQYLAWTFGVWDNSNDGTQRSVWMNQFMRNFLNP